MINYNFIYKLYKYIYWNIIKRWCFICRNTANNFCKDTRVPICSGACKMTHLEELDKLSRISEES